MTKTEEYLAEQDKKQERLRLTLACFMFCAAIGITFMARVRERIPPAPNSSGYYSGPWVNKRGDLISPDGKVLERGYRGSAMAQGLVKDE